MPGRSETLMSRYSFGLPKRVDARHRRHDDDVVAFEDRGRGGVPQLLDLGVDVRFLLDIGIRGRDIGLGLIIIVVAHEELHAVFREELAELRAELRGQRLVVRDDERRALRALDDVRHRERLAGARDAQQHLVAVALLDAVHQRVNRRRLVARGLVIGLQFKLGHGRASSKIRN